MGTQKIKFTIPGPPGRKQTVRVPGTGIAYTPKQTVQAQNLVKLCFQQAAPPGWQPWEGPVALWVNSYQAPPQSWPKWRKEALEARWPPVCHCCKTPDADNRHKCIGDALSGIAYRDDRQIVVVAFTKQWGSPRTKVTLQFLEAPTREGWEARRKERGDGHGKGEKEG